MCWLRSSKMVLYGIIIAIQIIGIYSASKICVQDYTEHLTIAAANIVDKCFGSSEGWSELMIISDHSADENLEKIYQGSKTSNSILFLNKERNNDRFIPSEKCNDYLNTGFEWQETKPRTVVIIIHGIKQLESVLSFLKKGIQKKWRPESNFFIVLETRCDVTECNNMFKIIWDYWILNAVVLCSSNDAANRNETEIELYTFNPYSGDHSRQWEIIINETVEVSISPGNFNHSWYIFKQRFTEIRSFNDCGDLFFDKTSNLDGYVIPISVGYDEFLLDTTWSLEGKVFAAESRTLKTISKTLQFDVTQVPSKDVNVYGRLLENGSYSGIMNSLYNGRSHLAPTSRGLKFYHGLGMTYPHDVTGACFASRIVGNRPPWTNLAVAKYIWIGLGLGLLFSTVVFYLQNKSHGIVSAFLDAERLFIGTSIIRPSTVIEHRIILGSIFLVLLVVDGVIRGRFISILTIVRPYPNLDTIQQLNEQNVDVYGHRTMKDAITDSRLKSRYHSLIKFTECLKSLEDREHQQACLAACSILHIQTSNSSIIHMSSTPAWKMYAMFLTAMHWPMKNRYSVEVQKLLESGIFQKWQLNMLREIAVNGWKLKRATEPPYVRPVKLNDLLPAYILFFVGLLIALIVFAWEMKSSKCFSCVKS